MSAAAFDEEGFYRVGDAVSLIDPADLCRGLRFSGRLSENFKMMTGTWVLVGELRAAILNRMAACCRIWSSEARAAIFSSRWYGSIRTVQGDMLTAQQARIPPTPFHWIPAFAHTSIGS